MQLNNLEVVYNDLKKKYSEEILLLQHNCEFFTFGKDAIAVNKAGGYPAIGDYFLNSLRRIIISAGKQVAIATIK